MAPDEVAVDGDPGWEDAYGFRRAGKEEFIRDPAFFNITNDKTVTHPSIFLTDREGHRRQRRILAHAFSQNAMYEQEPIIMKFVDLFISRIGEFAEKDTAIDIVKWFNFATFDIIGELTFGEPFGSLQESEMHPWVALIFGAIQSGEVMRFIFQYPLARWIVMSLIGKRLSEMRADHQALTIEKAERRMELGAEGTGAKDFMWYILKHNDEKGMTHNEILGNSSSLIVAGSETTATALSGLAYYLGKNPKTKQILVDEIRSKFSSEDQITMKSTAELPYMQACIEEGLRVFPPVVVTPTRVSPGDFVGGHYLPKNTRIVIHQHAVHHSPQNWYRPDDFCPERFLPQDHPRYDASFANDNKKCFQPFAYGPTNCIGKNLAYSELRLILGKLLFKFDMLPQPENQGWAETMKAFTLWAKPPLMTKFRAVQR